MPDSTPDHKTDHREEALGCLEWLGADDITRNTADDPRSGVALGVALVHSNLAIAEELRQVNGWLLSIANELLRVKS